MKFNVQKFNVAADAAEISQKIKQVALFESQRHSETDMSEMAKCIFSKPLQTGKGGSSPQPPRRFVESMLPMIFFNFQKAIFWMRSRFKPDFVRVRGAGTNFFKKCFGCGEGARFFLFADVMERSEK